MNIMLKNTVAQRMYILIIMLSFFSTVSFAREKKGLLIIAHGSHSSAWNNRVTRLERNVKRIMKNKGMRDYKYVKTCFLETKPSIYEGVTWLEKKGVKKIYAIPLFVDLSEHLNLEVPTVLGLYSDKEIIKKVRGEGLKIVDSPVRIVLGPPLSYGKVIKNIMLSRVLSLSKNPKEEGLVVLLHGSELYKPRWENLAREVGSFVTGSTRITYCDFAFVEVGQSFITNGIPVILKACEKRKRVIVVGLYLAMGVKKMAGNSTLKLGHFSMKSINMLKGKNIVFGEKGLLPDNRIAQWIVERAAEFKEKK